MQSVTSPFRKKFQCIMITLNRTSSIKVGIGLSFPVGGHEGSMKVLLVSKIEVNTVKPLLTATSDERPPFLSQRTRNPYIESCLKPLHNGHLFINYGHFCVPARNFCLRNKVAPTTHSWGPDISRKGQCTSIFLICKREETVGKLRKWKWQFIWSWHGASLFIHNRGNLQ